MEEQKAKAGIEVIHADHVLYVTELKVFLSAGILEAVSKED